MDEITKLYEEIDNIRELAQTEEGREVLADLVALDELAELAQYGDIRGF